MLRILFVDDEPGAAENVQRLTSGMQDEWNVHFAASADEALGILERELIDVVVSDIGMPDADGVEFLSTVRRRRPSTALILLSDDEGHEEAVRVTWIAHRFLGKPCDADLLESTISEIRAAQGDVSLPTIADLIGRVEQLPALGEVYQRLVRAIESGESNNEKLAAIVCEDVALTAEILRLLNSAFFGLSRRIESVGQAIGLIGTDVLRAIVASHSVFNRPDVEAVDADVINRRSQQVAALARRCHQTLNGATRSELADIYLAGMLHEAGALVLAMIDDSDMSEIKAVLSSNDNTVERLAFGVDRFSVSSHLLELWAFSPEIVNTVGQLSGRLDPPKDPMAWSIILARHIVMNGLADDFEDLDPEDLHPEDFEALINDVDTRLRQAAPAEPVEAPEETVASGALV